MLKKLNKKILYPINLTIFSVFSLTLLILVCVIISINYKQSESSAFKTADMLMEQNTNSIIMKIETLYEPLINITNIASELPIFGEKPTLQNHPAESYMLDSMDSYPQIQILYLGFSDGDFYEILSCKGDLKETIQNTVDAPIDTEFAILRQFTIPGSDEPVRIWKYLNGKRQTIGSRKEDYTGYDPRIRPWYINALNVDGCVKTDPYYFTNVKQMGVTISHTIDGNVSGVIGADILMNKLFSYLEGIKTYQREEILIFNEDFNITSDKKGSIPMIETESDTIKYIQKYLDKNGLEDNMNFLLKVAELDFLVKVKKLPNKYSNNEYLLMAQPRLGIMASIIKTTKNTAFISIIIMLFFLPIILIISKQISVPINNLVEEANKIAKFDLEENIIIKTKIKETQRLAEEMASMKRGIRLFSKYVPSQLVKKLMISGEDVTIGGTSKEMTFLFSDIKNFTNIAEKQNPSELMLRLSEYFEQLSSIIRSHSGTVDKFIGDAVMAFWNAPLDDTKHVENACLSAIFIQEKLNELHDKWINEGLEPFITRIGINTGNAVVGNMGSNDRMNYTAIGDVVNSCSRLEGINKVYGTSIIIGERVANKLDNKFVLRPLDKVIVKGKTESEIIYELIGIIENISNEKQLFASMFTNAFKLFYKREWVKAEKMFKNCLSYDKNDIQTKMYIKKCKENINLNPGENWDGIIKMEVK